MGAHQHARQKSPDTSDAGSVGVGDVTARLRPRPVPVSRAILQVGSADDALERAADRAADAAMARIAGDHDTEQSSAPTGTPTTVRRAAKVGREGGATSEDFTHRVETMRGHGRGLDDAARRAMERGFGTSLAGVRVHTDAAAADAAAEIGALAFTTGKDIFFGEGQYRPGTPDGDHMIGHEIAHTLQHHDSTRRISRLWNFQRHGMLNLNSRAAEVEPLDNSRLVLKVTDSDDEPLVVKSEDQPIGLGQLLGKVQKSASAADLKTVKFRPLHQQDIAELIWLLRDDARAGRDAKWAAYFDSSSASQYVDNVPDNPSDADKSQLAREGTVKWLMKTIEGGSSAVAMSFAEGKAMDIQAADGAAGPLLDTPGYLTKLGKMTVVDILFRNRDRVGANAGNWMATVDAKVTLIDNVDSAGNAMRNAWSENKFVDGSDDIAKLALSQLSNTADEYVQNLVYELDQKGGDDVWGNGVTPRAFLDSPSPASPGRTRLDVYTTEFETGLLEARTRLIKTFGASRFSITKKGRQARADRKKIKTQSTKAFAMDSSRSWLEKNAYDNDTKTFGDKTTTMQVDYFEVLKSRVKQMKSLK